MAESPVWKKPSDIMKNRRRKSVSQRRITTDAERRTSLIYKSPSKARKRTNPFICNSDQPTKRQNVDSWTQEKLDNKTTDNHQLFDMLETADQNVAVQSSSGKQIQHKVQPLSSDVDHYSEAVSPPNVPREINTGTRGLRQTTADRDTTTDEAADENIPTAYLPVDWSLKCKLRVVSSRPLNWCTQLRSSEEAHGITGFVHGDTCEVDGVVEQKQRFQQSCMYWIHPNLPWARLFPRIVDDSKQRQSSKECLCVRTRAASESYTDWLGVRLSKDNISFVPLLNDIVQKSLQSDWEQSFTSVYYQLRTGLCPYFYLCTHQLTVLFYHDKGGQSGPVALITPTTRGFRELLETEGISFKLPVGGTQQSPGKTQDERKSTEVQSEADVEKKREECCDQEEEGDDLLETDDAASGWLESMGLDKTQFPSLDPRKVKLQREGFRVIDNRPESLTYVSGSDVQALFNFLLNCRSCTAMSGAQAGIPPTILSPMAFRGATLKSHKVKHTAVKQSDRDGNISHAHIVEVTGPIMPSHCQALVTLFHKTQGADFGTVYNSHDPTIPFNILPTVMKKGVCKKCNCDSRLQRDSDKRTESAGKSSSQHELSAGGDGDKSDSGIKCDVCERTKSDETDALFRHVPVSNRLCCIKEFVCTKEGFTFTT